jgi:tetratricopeptide (TPR) repeat protein
MADAIEQRDFFISFNGADLAYAEAIDAALKNAGFTTYFHHIDLLPGGNIPKWMDDALMNSGQMLALYSPEYVADEAVYSEAERYARFWQDSRGAKFKIIPVVLRDVKFTPLMGVYKRIGAKGMTPAQAASAVVAALKKPDEVQQREVLHSVEPQPKIFNVLYRHNPNFTGRFEAMDSLQKSLRDGNAAITAVAGMGGVGKTTLAAEYCHRFGGRFGGVWWVRAEQEPVMLADLATLGQRLGLAATDNIEADARATLESVTSRSEPWLMVYDNAPNPDAVTNWLPAGAVRCLITSRFTRFDGIATVTQLDQWSKELTVDYLLGRTGREDRTGALRLADTLGGLPLAAEQAAVFLRDRKGITFEDYAQEISRLIKQERPTGAKGDYPDTVYAAFVKSLEALGAIKGGKTALDLLRLCAFLSPDGVDEGLLLVESANKQLPTNFSAAMADRFDREDAAAALATLSLVRREDRLIGPALIFHRLLLEVVRDWMGASARELWAEAAVRLVDRQFPWNPADDLSQWLLCSRLITHVASLEAHAPHTNAINQRLDRLLNQASVYLAVRGNRTGALNMALASVALARLTAEDNPLGLATSLSNLGAFYTDLKNLNKAEDCFREALSIQEPRLDSNDPALATTLSNLAGVHRELGQFAQVEPLLLRVADVMKSAYGAESLEYGISLMNLDSLYDDWAERTGDLEKRRIAQDYSARALSVTTAALGFRHPQTSGCHANLSILRARREDWVGATEQAERAVAIMLSLDLAEHPDTLNWASVLATVWKRSNQMDKAVRLEAGDILDLLPVIAQIEAEHRTWVAEDSKNRGFGPPSPYAKN